MRLGREGEVGGRWGIMLHDHVFRARKQCSLVNPTVYNHRQQSRLNYCTGCINMCFPSRKHWGLESTVQILILGNTSGGVQ